ncbi:MAG: ABC-2 type transport system permease protein [Akkermansiaceae bacterium]|jgi:ABC-2 type transport system permease protein|tara:strand:- start:10572 stop:11309 length:738 start_codon:yes stop_codon:yes gene_type:complete
MNTLTIFKRELTSYFTQPTAYAIVIIFGFLSILLAFTIGNFWAIDDASLHGSFFRSIPLLLMILVPAVSMRQWSDEHYTGTIELLGTFPINLRSAIWGKFLASAMVWALALALTFPIVSAVNYLGDPDNWTIFSGYLGTFLVCLTFLAITTLVSAFTRDQVVALIVSVAICCLLTICGWEPVINEVRRTGPDAAQAVDIMTKFGIYSHFFEATLGKISITSLLYFFGLIIICLLGTNLVLKSQRS